MGAMDRSAVILIESTRPTFIREVILRIDRAAKTTFKPVSDSYRKRNPHVMGYIDFSGSQTDLNKLLTGLHRLWKNCQSAKVFLRASYLGAQLPLYYEPEALKRELKEISEARKEKVVLFDHNYVCLAATGYSKMKTGKGRGNGSLSVGRMVQDEGLTASIDT